MVEAVRHQRLGQRGAGHARLGKAREDRTHVDPAGGDGRHLVNVGVIGRPENDGTTRVWYTLLTSDPGRDLDVEFVPIDYDHEALAREMEAESLPPESALPVSARSHGCNSQASV